MATKKPKSIIPYLFIAFIVVYVSLDSIFIYLSRNSYNGIVTDNAYEKGTNYNDVIKRNEAQKELGWIGELVYEIVNETAIELKFTLLDKEHRPISKARVEAFIMRPVTDRFDKKVIFKETSTGTYIKKVEMPLKGQWEIKLKAYVDDKEYFLNKRINLPRKRELINPHAQ